MDKIVPDGKRIAWQAFLIVQSGRSPGETNFVTIKIVDRASRGAAVGGCGPGACGRLQAALMQSTCDEATLDKRLPIEFDLGQFCARRKPRTLILYEDAQQLFNLYHLMQ